MISQIFPNSTSILRVEIAASRRSSHRFDHRETNLASPRSLKPELDGGPRFTVYMQLKSQGAHFGGRKRLFRPGQIMARISTASPNNYRRYRHGRYTQS